MSSLQNRNAGKTPAAFHLDQVNGKAMGVCAGLANYFGGDPLVWRMIFVLGTVFGFGSFVVIYLAIGLLAD
jgi:phage shock protein PspC (stress-responsive transcriptional regulator)